MPEAIGRALALTLNPAAPRLSASSSMKEKAVVFERPHVSESVTMMLTRSQVWTQRSVGCHRVESAGPRGLPGCSHFELDVGQELQMFPDQTVR
jgi:hypothetical protein